MAQENATKHPKGLMVLFFTEMWERFGFYLIIGILFLYMTTPLDQAFPGLGFDNITGADVLGTYLALVYLTPFIGGLLADRILGYRKSIFIGGFLMGTGYILMSVHNELVFYIALLLIIIGNGFFKPNISALVGNLYNEDKYKKLKDSGFNIFYMGINIGAFLCNFIAAYLRLNYGWGWAFAAAGVGMYIGLIWFATGQKHVAHADVIKPAQEGDQSITSIVKTLFVPAFIAGIVGWYLPTLIFGGPMFGKPSTDAFLLFSIPIVWFYYKLYSTAGNKADKERIGALLSVMGVVVIFWAVFHQNATALTNWAENYTDREAPAFVEGTLKTLKLDQSVNTVPKEVLITDQHFVAVLDENGNKQYETGIDSYFKNIPELDRPAPDKEVALVSTEIFQSVNPGFIILFTPLVVGFFMFLRKRNMEPSTPTKIGLGLLITALSSLVMMFAVFYTDNGLLKASAWWLVIYYSVVTVGELFLSPMGLSLVSKLSPPRFAALMMGGWFLSTSIGNKLSGVLATMWAFYDNKAFFFITNTVLAMVAVVSIFMMLPRLKRIVKEYAE